MFQEDYLKKLKSAMVSVKDNKDFYSYNDEKIDLYEVLSEQFSLIQIRDKTKCPIESSWNQWCKTKRGFDKDDYVFQNAGIACGEASDLFVLDIDNVPKFLEYARAHGIDTNFNTLVVKTLKGIHVYFKYPNNGKRYGNKVINVAGVHLFDTRGDGGQVLAPGTRHPDADIIYEIINYDDIADAPQWLLDLYEEQPENKIKGKDERPDIITNDINIENLPINDKTKWMILNDWEKGGRSEKEMSVIDQLVIQNISDSQILDIFEKYPIGEKHRERGATRFSILQNMIDKAKVVCADKIKINANSNNDTQWRRKSLAEISKSKIKLEYLIDGFWPKNEGMILFGQGGTGKSGLTLEIALEIASPTKEGLFGKFKVNKLGKVLFFQSENSEAALSDRIRIRKNSQRFENENIQFVTIGNDLMMHGDIKDETFYNKVSEQIEEFRPDLVIFDPLVSFHVADENANVAMRNVLDRFTMLQKKHNVNVLIVHHSGKTDSGGQRSAGRGASAIFDWCRNCIELKRTGSDGNDFELIHHKASNFKEFGKIKLTRNDDMSFSVGAENGKNSCGNIVLKAMENLGGKSKTKTILTDEIKKLSAADGKSYSTGKIHGLIEEMIDAGEIVTSGTGNNGIGLKLKSYSELSIFEGLDFD